MELTEIYSELLAHVPISTELSQLAKEKASAAFQFLTQGYQMQLQDLAKNSLYSCENAGPVLIKDLALISLCEHHLLPIIGKCHILYLPDQQVLGLGKFTEVVTMFSRRLQLQERLTQEIAEAIQELTKARGVAVKIEAQHLCLALKGMEKCAQPVITAQFLGSFAGHGLELFRD